MVPSSLLVALELCPECRHCLMEAGFHRAGGATDAACYLIDLEVAPEAQQDYSSVFWRECPKRPTDIIAAGEVPERVGAGHVPSRLHWHKPNGPPAARTIQTNVDQDAIEPALQRRAVRKRRSCLPGSCQRLLGGIFRLGGISQHIAGK